MKVIKTEPKSIEEINQMMEDFGSDYHLEELENGEIVMVKNDVIKKQVQKNLLAHLKKEL